MNRARASGVVLRPMRRNVDVHAPAAALVLALAMLPTATSAQDHQWQLARTAVQLETPFAVAPGVNALTAWQAAHADAGDESQRATMLLALLACGSTMRQGPQKDPIKKLAVAIRAAEAQSAPTSVGDQLLTALALQRCFAVSSYQLLKPDCKRWLARLQRHVDDPTTAPIRPEDLVLLRLLAGEAEAAGIVDATGEAELTAAIQGARVTFRLGQSRRSDAANLLLERLAGKKVEDDRLIATCWPANPAADPLHTWLAVHAALLVAAPLRQSTLAQLAPLVDARIAEGKEHAGTWEPTAGFDRITTTGLFTLALATANGALAAVQAGTGR